MVMELAANEDLAWWAKMEVLKEELRKCDAQTKAFLGPILKYEPVKQLLLSFLNDRSKSVEEWIWDPNTQRVLTTLKERAPDMDVPVTDGMFFEELSYQRAEKVVAEDDSGKVAEGLIEAALKVKEEAKAKFVDKNYFAAMNAYNRAAELLQDRALGGSEEAEAKGRQVVVDCRCNAAVCGWRGGDLEGVKTAATKALEVDGSCVKALYWRARANEKLELHDNALIDLKRALSVGNGDVSSEVKQWHDKVQAVVKAQDEARRRMSELRAMREEEARSRGETVFSSDDEDDDDEDEEVEELEEDQHRYHGRYRRGGGRQPRVIKNPDPSEGLAYRMPRPPDMTEPDMTPLTYVSQFMHYFKDFLTLEQEEKEVEGSKPPRFEHVMKLPPYLEVHAQETSHKRARQLCALNFLKAAQDVYRTQNKGVDKNNNPIPTEPKGWKDAKDRFDAWTAAMEARAKGLDRPLQPQEFIDYADAWMDAIVVGKIPAGRFPHTLSTDERRAIHARVGKHGLKSVSVGPAEQRQLSVILKDAGKRAERKGYVEIPPAPIVPSPEVLEDLTVIEAAVPLPVPQPPPPPKPQPPPRHHRHHREHRRGPRDPEEPREPPEVLIIDTSPGGVTRLVPNKEEQQQEDVKPSAEEGQQTQTQTQTAVESIGDVLGPVEFVPVAEPMAPVDEVVGEAEAALEVKDVEA